MSLKNIFSASVLVALMLVASFPSINALAPIPSATVRVTGANANVYLSTAADGRFNGAIPAGNYTVDVIVSGYVFGKLENVVVTAGNTTDLGDIPLGRSGKVTGTAVGPHGEPITDLQITISDQSTNASISGTILKNGTFQFNTGLKNGTYFLEINPQWDVRKVNGGYLAKRIYDIHVVEGETTSGVVVPLDYSARISGHVRATNGSPISMRYVYAYLNDTYLLNYAVTDSDGFYNISNCLTNGSYKIMVSAGGYGAEESYRYVDLVTGEEVKDFDFALVPSAIVSGTVTYSNGYPAPGIMIYFTPLNNHTACVAYTDHYGRYRLATYLYNGSYVVQPSYPSAPSQTVTVVEGEETKNVDFTLPSNGNTYAFVAGLVNDSLGNSLAYTAIQAGANSGSSDTNGYFFVPVTLPPDTMTLEVNVSASKIGFATATVGGVTLTPNSTTTVNFTLNALPKGNLQGRIIDPLAQTPKQAVQISIQSSASNVTAGSNITLTGTLSANANGTVTIFRSVNGSNYLAFSNATLVAGTYSLTASLSQPGTYSFYAYWPESSDYLASNSTTLTITCTPAQGPPPQPSETSDNTLFLLAGGAVGAAVIVGLLLLLRKRS
ncbi:MAG: carboxypeptidase regulatory-like domain-containing protein [Candidatus Methanomethylicia archaeon]|nr:carboxypeptidase regulatory-like domain-containing protein [Candidatus Methanomethylicia archaeon]